MTPRSNRAWCLSSSYCPSGGTSAYTCKCPPATTFPKEMYEKEPHKAIQVCDKLENTLEVGMVGNCDAPGVYVCEGPDQDPKELKSCPHCSVAVVKGLSKKVPILDIVCNGDIDPGVARASSQLEIHDVLPSIHYVGSLPC